MSSYYQQKAKPTELQHSPDEAVLEPNPFQQDAPRFNPIVHLFIGLVCWLMIGIGFFVGHYLFPAVAR